MRLRRLLFAFVLWAGFITAAPLHFRITLSPEASPKPATGRMLVFLSDSPQPQEVLWAGFVPGNTWVAAMEVESIAPGQAIDFDPDVKAFPRPFSQAKPGAYQVMALLDVDHSYNYTRRNEGDLYGPVVKIENLNPANARPVELVLNKRTEAQSRPAETDNLKLVEFESPLLAAFWGRPIVIRAGVVLPPGFSTAPDRRYPAVYHNHGFGGDYRGAWGGARPLLKAIEDGKALPMVHVFLDGSFPTGDHEFADSVNNGPWGRALTAEFIPYLEQRFRLIEKPSARFLTGHSSGGWASLWLQVAYPDFFGGCWATAPDPVDFRSFTGIDATPGSNDNAYRRPDGSPHYLIRMRSKDTVTIETFTGQEDVLGEYGGQMASFEWVFSPKGPDGRPMKLFNRVTGELDSTVEQAWRKYDIRLILEANWPTLEPKLRGKVNVICGGQDTFYLDEAVAKLCDLFKRKGSDAVCEIVPGRDHSNLYAPYTTYPDGLATRIQKEMEAKLAGK